MSNLLRSIDIKWLLAGDRIKVSYEVLRSHENAFALEDISLLKVGEVYGIAVRNRGKLIQLEVEIYSVDLINDTVDIRVYKFL